MKNTIKYIITCLCCIFLSVIGTIITLNYFDLNKTTNLQTKNVTVTEKDTIKDSIDNIYNAVVLVTANVKATSMFGQTSTNTSTGSGFVYKTDSKYAYILTNYHVIEDASDLKVTTMNDQQLDAKLLGADEYTDIAVLAVKKDYITLVATIGDSTEVELGDTVFTVGSPMGSSYMGSVTKGILSGKDREVTLKASDGSSMMMQVLQTDAAINPGNSGGPLLNINGEVIGITSSKLSDESIEGMGFAIPIEISMNEVERLEEGKKIERPVLGAEMLDVDSTYALYRSGIDIDKNLKEGAVVVTVQNGSAAAEAGIKPGDVITMLNDDNVKSVANFKFLLYKYNKSETVKITIIRDGNEKTLSVTLK